MTQWHLVLPNKGLEISKSNNQFQYHVCLLICCFLTMLAWSSNINLNECKSNYHVKILIPATMCTCVLILFILLLPFPFAVFFLHGFGYSWFTEVVVEGSGFPWSNVISIRYWPALDPNHSSPFMFVWYILHTPLLK